MQGASEPIVAADEPKSTAAERGSALEVLRIFLRLGLTSFGGPVAHLGYFRAEFVERRKWLDDHTYSDIVALWQFLPGPTSSQVGITLGIMRAGLLGAAAAWLGFTMPSAVAMILFGYGVTRFGDLSGAAWLHGLKIVAVAVVAQAVWGMARSLCPDRAEPLRIWATIAVGAAILALAVPSAIGQVGAILGGGLIGWALLGTAQMPSAGVSIAVHVPRAWSVAAAILFFALLIGLPVLAAAVPAQPIKLLDSFYRSGSLVFGGGHVVLPLLQAEVGAARLGVERRLPRRLWRGPGGAGSALYLCRLSRHGDGAAAERLGRWPPLPGGDFPAVLPAAARRPAVLGRAAPPPGGAVGDARRQRGGRRVVAGRALSAGLDQRDLRPAGFRDRHRRLPAACAVGSAALARRHSRRPRRKRRGDGGIK